MKPRLIVILITLAALAAVVITGVALGQEGAGQTEDPAPERPDVVSNRFTYQGQLEKSGSLVDGKCDFRFKLYDAASGGSQVGSTEAEGNVTLKDGRFTVILNFGAYAFNGDNRWLEIGARCPAGGGSYTTLSPRQRLFAPPYTLHLGQTAIGEENPLVITGTFDMLTTNTGNLTKPGAGEGAPLVLGNALNTYTCTGPADDPCDTGAALRITDAYYGIYIEKTGGNAIYVGDAQGSSGIYVADARYYGVTGNSTMQADECCYPVGVEGYGYNYSTNGGIYAYGLYGFAYRDGSTGGGQARGVYGSASAANGAVAYAGYFSGDINVTGAVIRPATVTKIDNPLNPDQEYLYHAPVESADMMNLYNGNVVLDSNGQALVEMPEWFEALNMEFRYQLTPIGAPGPNLYIAEKIQDNRFKIAGGEPGMEVSWQVTGIRNDPYAQDHRVPVEQTKPEGEQGTYLYPQGYGKPESLGLDSQDRAQMEAQRQQARQEAGHEPQQ
jgi:hypothetical protein